MPRMQLRHEWISIITSRKSDMRLALKRKSNIVDAGADSPGLMNQDAAKAAGSTFNPYIAARREWDERYGEIITRAKNWRFIAILSTLATLVAAAGIVVLSVRS